jgi:hypothetical protein
VNAFQIAAPPHVPDHYRFLVLGKLEEVGRELGRSPAVTQGVGSLNGAAIKFGNPDHKDSLTTEITERKTENGK